MADRGAPWGPRFVGVVVGMWWCGGVGMWWIGVHLGFLAVRVGRCRVWWDVECTLGY